MDDIKVQEVKGKASQGPVHVELDKDVLITPEEIHKLRQSHPDLSSNPIQVEIFMSRGDARFETICDFYVREDERSSITTQEVFEKFSMKELLPILLSKPPTSLFFTVVAHISGNEDAVDKDSTMDESTLKKYGFLKND